MTEAAPLTTRRQVTAALSSHREPEPFAAAAMIALDLIVYAAAWAGMVSVSAWWAKSACALVAALATARLFISGHDACHGSAFRSRWANHASGRLAFLPSLTPFSTWELGHNTLHHGFTNLRGKDYVYTPLSKSEYDALPRWRRAAERFYRSPAGPGLFYLVEVWWKKLWFPMPSQTDGFRARYLGDSLLTAAFAAVQAGVAMTIGERTGQGPLVLAVFTLAVPFLIWNMVMGFVTFQHHTHPGVAWYANRADWDPLRAQVDNTPRVVFPWPVGTLLGNIMEHTAHHVDSRIPLFHLPDAQADVERLLPRRVTVTRWSWRAYRDTCRRCQLFDYENRRWLRFDGTPS